jgi:ribosome-associated protein
VDTIAAGAAAPSGQAAGDPMLDLILTSLDEDKAEDIVQIDLRGKSSVADHMVVCSGRSTRQVSALADKLADRLKPVIGRAPRSEGKAQGDWVLLDAGDVIVHIFRPEVREFYQIEKMWQDPSETRAT